MDTWGRKQMMMAGMFVVACADFSTASCTTIAALIPARLALGAGRSAAEGRAQCLVCKAYYLWYLVLPVVSRRLVIWSKRHSTFGQITKV